MLPFPGFKGCIEVMIFSEHKTVVALLFAFTHLLIISTLIINLSVIIFWVSTNSHLFNIVAISILRYLVSNIVKTYLS